MCADVVVTALLLYTTRLVHTLTHIHTHIHTHTSLSPPECTPVWYVLFAAPVALVSAVVVGRVKLCTFSPLSLVGVHWSMFYGSNTCFFFSSVRLSYALLSLPLLYSLAVALSSSSSCILLRLLSIVTGWESLFTAAAAVNATSDRGRGRRKTGGDGPHIIRGRRTHYKARSFNIVVSSGPCETAPAAAKESRELLSALSHHHRYIVKIMRQKYKKIKYYIHYE